MAIGSYGTIRPSDVSPEDVEIILNYTPSRDVTSNFVLTQLDAQTILKPYFNNTQTGGNAGVEDKNFPPTFITRHISDISSTNGYLRCGTYKSLGMCSRKS
jgi:hypothetical protein